MYLLVNDRAGLRLLGYAGRATLLGKNMHGWFTLPTGRDALSGSRNARSSVPSGKEKERSEKRGAVACRRQPFPRDEDWPYPMRREVRSWGRGITFVDITDRRRVEEKFAA